MLLHNTKTFNLIFSIVVFKIKSEYNKKKALLLTLGLIFQYFECKSLVIKAILLRNL